jgi:hypothetical protein
MAAGGGIRRGVSAVLLERSRVGFVVRKKLGLAYESHSQFCGGTSSKYHRKVRVDLKRTKIIGWNLPSFISRYR